MKLVENPILARELKERMRSFRAPMMLTIYLLFIGFSVVAMERAASGSTDAGQAATGLQLFHVLVLILLGFVCFLVPAFSAPLISSERERQTFHLVQVTALTPFQIVLGKLSAAVAWLLMLIIATLPLMAITTVLGGVTFGDLLVGTAMLMFCGITIASFSIAISSRLRRNAGSSVLSFVVVLALVAGTPMLFGFTELWARQDELATGRQHRRQTWTLVLNPFVGTAAAVHRAGTSTDDPIGSIGSFLQRTDEGFASVPDRVIVGDGTEGGIVDTDPGANLGAPAQPNPAQPNPAPAPGPRDRVVPFWVWTVFWYSLIIAGSIRFAMTGVSAPTHVFRSGRKKKGGVEA